MEQQPAWDFLNKLGISQQPLSVTLLDAIAKQLSYKQPFQNLSILSVPVPERKPLDFQNLDERMLAYGGGVCIDLNMFSYRILKGIGFEASIIGGGVDTDLIIHVCVIVRNVETAGDIYLIDTGFGYPTLRAIPLDFEKDSPVYQDSFLTYKYVKQERRYVRLHEPKGCIIRPFDHQQPDGWVITYWMTLDVINPEDAVQLLWKNVLMNPQCPPLKYFRVNGFADGVFVAVKGYYHYEEKDGGLVKRRMASRQEVLDFVLHRFPGIPPKTVDLALKYHDEHLASNVAE